MAVRSSGTSEDMPDASFAGQGDTYLWTVGADAVVDRVRDCWASLFTARAIAYRGKHNLAHLEQAMAVGVQQMADARAAGVAMSLDPANGDRSKIVIESVWGLGEPLVSGHATPDYFVVDKVLLEPDQAGRCRASRPNSSPTSPIKRLSCARWKSPGATSRASPTRKFAPSLGSSKRSIGPSVRPRTSNGRSMRARTENEGVVLLQCRPETVWSRKASAPVVSRSYAPGIEGVLSTLMAPLAARKH